MIPFFQGAAGGAPVASQLFATTLYTGNGSSRSIVNGLNLSGVGGLVWQKARASDGGNGHSLFDTQRGGGFRLSSDSTSDEGSGYATTFNSDGFSFNNTENNTNLITYVAWSFARAARFFDVVTYTGTGSARTISHNLGATPGMIIIKRRDTTGAWPVYHRANTGAPETDYLVLNTTAATADLNTYWNDTAPTASEFTVGTNNDVNASGGTYVAYLFAHDTASDGIVQCGSYTGTGTSGNTVTLGWQPQWVLFKRAVQPSGADPWIILDATRVVNNSLCPNTSSAENGDVGVTGSVTFTSTGFTLNDNNRALNNNTDTYVYLAIRSA